MLAVSGKNFIGFAIVIHAKISSYTQSYVGRKKIPMEAEYQPDEETTRDQLILSHVS